jgi:hypothetical protein
MMNNVAQIYNQNPEREWQRLAVDPYHSLEFLVTMHYLQKHLPPSRSAGSSWCWRRRLNRPWLIWLNTSCTLAERHNFGTMGGSP